MLRVFKITGTLQVKGDVADAGIWRRAGADLGNLQKKYITLSSKLKIVHAQHRHGGSIASPEDELWVQQDKFYPGDVVASHVGSPG